MMILSNSDNLWKRMPSSIFFGWLDSIYHFNPMEKIEIESFAKTKRRSDTSEFDQL